MNKLPVFEVDTHVCHFLLGCTAGEKHQISLTQIAAGDFVAFFKQTIGASGQTDIIYFFIELRYQSGTIYSVLVVTACAVADTHPLRRGNVQFVIIFHIYVNTHADRSFCQCLVIEPGR